ncbi:MAG TPA: GDSL-type esterase/lipase family protein [Phycisphaerae bacterium]
MSSTPVSIERKLPRWRSWAWTVLLFPFLVLPYRWLWVPCGLAASILVFHPRRTWRELLAWDHTLIVGSVFVLLARTGMDPAWWLPWLGVLMAIGIARRFVRDRRRWRVAAIMIVWVASIAVLTRPTGQLMRSVHNVPRNAVLVCAGDSLTAGVDPTSDSGTYVARLRERLGCTVINAGAVNDKVGDLVGRLDKDVLRRHPTAVLLFIGGNDYLNETPRGRFAQELDRVAARIRASGAMLILVEVPSGIVWNPYAGVYRRVAARYGAELIPESHLRWSLSVEFVARPMLSDPFTSDGIHLSAGGARQVADWFEPYVRRALTDPHSQLSPSQ